MGRSAIDGESPVSDMNGGMFYRPQVLRDTRNPVGIWEDHLLRLNTPWRPIADSTVRER
jgi:hypothetical protein